MTNLLYADTRVTIGDNVILTITEWGNWQDYQKRDRNIPFLMLSGTATIPGIHKNIFSMTQALLNGFQMMSEGEALILKKNLN